jgi:aryl-alcohol dehydrogenase-like predicted oxidoreductase
VVIATKVGPIPGDESKGGTASRLRIIRGLEASLQALGCDYVDLYQIHRPDPETPIDETLRALDDLVTSGKVRYIGCSNYAAWETCAALWASRTQHVSPFVSVQPRYNMLNREIEAELVPLCQKYNLGILPYYPLAGGFLTGKYRRQQPAPEGARLTYHTRQAQQWISEPNLDLLEELERFSARRDHTLVDLAFAWLLANDQVSSVIAGATRPEQVQANAAAGAWRLTAEEKTEVDGILASAP